MLTPDRHWRHPEIAFQGDKVPSIRGPLLSTQNSHQERGQNARLIHIPYKTDTA